MEKTQRIDSFLHLIAEISKNGVEIDSNLVYSNLIRLGIKRSLIENYFTSWQEKFARTQNIHVFVSPTWKNFCQFIGQGSKTLTQNKLKMYIPLDESHIYHGVNKIFEFTSKNNIPHKSKVANYTRFDDVVLRVDGVNSLETIRRFVNSDEYIREGLIDTNPFAITDGVISFALDGNLSYNTVVSEWISEYINSMKDNLDFVSYSSFYEYVSKRYKEVFKDGKEINSFYKGRDLRNNTEELANYQRVTELLLISLRRDSKLLDLYKFHEFIKDPESEREVFENISRLQRKDSRKVIEIPSEVKEAFDYAFLEISKKETPEIAVSRFKKFAETGKYEVFTRSNGVRTLIKEMIDIPLAQRLIYEEEKTALINASLETINKYDSIQLGRGLFGIQKGDYKGFTGANGARDRLKLWVKSEDISDLIHNILLEEGYIDLDDNEEYWVFIELISKLKEKSK